MLIRLAVWLIVAAVAGCAMSTAPPDSVSPAQCDDLLGRTPRAVGDELATAGYHVSWRLETTEEEGPVSDVVDHAPDGVVTDIVISDRTAVIFVSPPDDPILSARPRPTSCSAG